MDFFIHLSTIYESDFFYLTLVKQKFINQGLFLIIVFEGGKNIAEKINNRHGECSYHLCDKKRVELFKCKHCDDYYCKEHLKAKEPQLTPFKSTDVDRHIRWDKKGGHPCLPYFDYVVKKEKEQKVAMFSKPSKPAPIIKYVPEPDINIDEIEKYNDNNKDDNTSDNSLEDWLKEKQKEIIAESEPKEEVKKCFECGEKVGYLGERFITDKNTGELIARHTKNKYNPKTKKYIKSLPKHMVISKPTMLLFKRIIGNRKKGTIFVNRDGERLTKTWFQLFIDEIATSIGIQKITHITPSGKDYHLVILKALREAGERHCDLAGADSDITARGAQHSAIVKEKHYKKTGWEEVQEQVRKYHPAF